MQAPLNSLKLLLPALIPSWNFFDVVAPSPRIEYVILSEKFPLDSEWRPFRPRPKRISTFEMIKRLFWNPHWNDTLFATSCAERLVQDETEHSINEIFLRILEDVLVGPSQPPKTSHLQFRLVFIQRTGNELTQEVLYISPYREIKL